MTSETTWNELTAQQLVRYEALFTLLDDIHALEDIAEIGRCVAQQWKYSAAVTAWRLVVANERTFVVVDGFRGQAEVHEVHTLGAWDERFWILQRPQLLPARELGGRAGLPRHLTGSAVHELKVLPVIQAGRCIALLTAAARREPFSELDSKFIQLFARHFAERVATILAHRQTTEKLLSKASLDALTGLLNRGAIAERLLGQLALARRMTQPLSVALVDIDYFKVINDTFGHLAGDEVLREMARRLHLQTRTSDALGRYGGEEFLFVLYPCDTADLAEVSERFRRSVADAPFQVDGEATSHALEVTISLGAASTADHPDASMQSLLKHADDALYESKSGGRNRVTISAGPTPRRR